MMFSDPAGRNKAATPRPHGSVPINREDYVVPMSIPGTGRNAIVSRSHDVDTAGGQDRVAREDYRAQVLAEIREDLSRRGIDLADRAWSEQHTATGQEQVDEIVDGYTPVETDDPPETDKALEAENNADDSAVANAESTDDTDNTEVTDSADPVESTDSSWDSWGDEADEFDDVFGDDDELADSEDIPEDLDDILGDDLDDIPDDV